MLQHRNIVWEKVLLVMDEKKRLVISIKVKDKKYEVHGKRKEFDAKYGRIADETEKNSLNKQQTAFIEKMCCYCGRKGIAPN